jgi:hypothetical protein
MNNFMTRNQGSIFTRHYGGRFGFFQDFVKNTSHLFVKDMGYAPICIGAWVMLSIETHYWSKGFKYHPSNNQE